VPAGTLDVPGRIVCSDQFCAGRRGCEPEPSRERIQASTAFVRTMGIDSCIISLDDLPGRCGVHSACGCAMGRSTITGFAVSCEDGTGSAFIRAPALPSVLLKAMTSTDGKSRGTDDRREINVGNHRNPTRGSMSTGSQPGRLREERRRTSFRAEKSASLRGPTPWASG